MHNATTTTNGIYYNGTDETGKTRLLAYPVSLQQRPGDDDTATSGTSFSLNKKRHPLDRTRHPTKSNAKYSTNYITNQIANNANKANYGKLVNDGSSRNGGKIIIRRSNSKMNANIGYDDTNYVKRDSYASWEDYASQRSVGHQRKDYKGFILPPNEFLSPRVDVWIYLFVSCVVGVASLASGNSQPQTTTSSGTMSTYDILTMTFLSIDAAMACLVALFFLYRPSRVVLTKRSPLYGSLEMALATLGSLFWCCAFAFQHLASDSRQLALLMTTTTKSNHYSNTGANVFYSIWMAGCFHAYLVADLFTGDRRGVSTFPLPNNNGTTTDNHSHYHADIHLGRDKSRISKIWVLLLLSSTVLFAFGLSLQNGPLCQEKYWRPLPFVPTFW